MEQKRKGGDKESDRPDPLWGEVVLQGFLPIFYFSFEIDLSVSCCNLIHKYLGVRPIEINKTYF